MIGTPEYDRSFWNAMRGKGASDISDGYITATGMYAIPTATGSKLTKTIDKDSIFRNVGAAFLCRSKYLLESFDLRKAKRVSSLKLMLYCTGKFEL